MNQDTYLRPSVSLRGVMLTATTEINRLRYRAQSILIGLIEDRYYLPTEFETREILSWAHIK